MFSLFLPSRCASEAAELSGAVRLPSAAGRALARPGRRKNGKNGEKKEKIRERGRGGKRENGGKGEEEGGGKEKREKQGKKLVFTLVMCSEGVGRAWELAEHGARLGSVEFTNPDRNILLKICTGE